MVVIKVFLVLLFNMMLIFLTNKFQTHRSWLSCNNCSVCIHLLWSKFRDVKMAILLSFIQVCYWKCYWLSDMLFDSNYSVPFFFIDSSWWPLIQSESSTKSEIHSQRTNVVIVVSVRICVTSEMASTPNYP